MSASDQVERILKSHNCVLLRDGKHEVWRLPNGNKFTRPKTPSCGRSHSNSLSDLKEALGLTQHKTTVGVRRQKPKKQKPDRKPAWTTAPVNTTMAEKLMVSGAVEGTLRARIEELTSEADSCPWCRVRRWVKALRNRA